VIGQEFDVVLLERVNEESAGTLAELMRESVEVGIVAAPSRETYQFTRPPAPTRMDQAVQNPTLRMIS